ncbi:hypothetical protein CVT25_010299 [Psilocybe cyanescens]|uniref:RED-like N-terminal domain-containing protein n=1 Tax=Psilocybe cyanescens TaxID=93625 RepID=A0A409VNM6_PSICY|nr:hypothetical protein CVT25_010299 [Psilocybe cyanescens]
MDQVLTSLSNIALLEANNNSSLKESFRRLLQTPRPGGSSALGAASGSRGSLLVPPPKKKTAGDASQPAFKPRAVKKVQDTKASKYRDRAAERRVGDGNDYAHIEAVLEDFEKKNADEDKANVEEQRKYLGGDSEHSILVKGLDFALLEQNKARSVMTNDDVDALDQAFLESSAHSTMTAPKKRTREDLLRELKEQRAGGSDNTVPGNTAKEDARLLEQAKQKGKFKPIGRADVKKKKSSKSEGAEGDKKRKKRKMDTVDSSLSETNATADSSMPPPPLPVKAAAPNIPVQEEVIDNDFDIFAGVGDYEGIDIGDDEDEHEHEAAKPKSTTNSNVEEGEKPPLSHGPKRWIATDEPEPITEPSIPIPADMSKHASSSRSSPPPGRDIGDDEGMEEDQPMRLAPLASSALPSIKEFLAMDKAASSHDKKKKRKEKKGGEDNGEEDSKKTLEAKVDRDYQRLKSYTEKKAAAGSR